jgi:predicted nucleic acid-binding protein
MADEGPCRTLQQDFSLGPGEAETIWWAASQRAQAVVATDDRMAIRACRALGIPWTSALSIVIRMHERRLLSGEMARGLLQALSVHGRYSRALIEEAANRLKGHPHG